MPDLSVSGNIDGLFVTATSFGTENYPSIRNASAATQAPSTTISNSTQGAGVVQFAGTISINYRSFFVFNTSGITVAPSSATFSVFTRTNRDSPCRIIKYGGYSDASITTGDYDDIPGFSANNTMSGNVTDYSGVVSVSDIATDGNRTDVTLNATALSDMASLSLFQIMIVNNTYDYTNTNPAGQTVDERWGMYYSNNSGDSLDPFISYVAGATGYSHDVSGLAAGSIGKIKALAAGSIGKVIGK